MEKIVKEKPETKNSDIDKKNIFNDKVSFVEKRRKKGEEKTWLDVNINDKIVKLNKEHTLRDIYKMMFNKAISNLPKWIFFFMPFFAFGLWLTHDKKKWWFFDHGIFTFHFFSTFLLLLSVTTLLSVLVGLIGYEFNEWYDFVVFMLLQIIFYKSYRKFYRESRVKTFMKLGFFYFFNFIMFLIIMVIAYIHTVYTL